MTCDELYKELIEKINHYHPHTRLELVDRAYRLAYSAHDGQFRKSGEPFMIHPLWVAVILAELRLDTETIVAALLHDVAEDTQYTIEDIAVEFGDEVALLVDGVTKLKKFQYTSKTDEMAENYRKMFFAMSKDIRIIIIKIADRLHNMRTLQYQSEKKQIEIAQETLEIYAPLAHKLGISRIRYELEDLGFKYQDRESYSELAKKIGLRQAERHAMIEEIVQEIYERLEAYSLKAVVDGRPKHFFSIYKKMISKGKQLDEIYDLFAVRVLVEELQDCYQVLGILHEIYTPLPGRVKDFIAMAKPNRYQSLHTTLMRNGDPFEVQIRTHDMHKIAEFGIAAHWRYKTGKTGKSEPDSAEDKLQWLGRLLEWQRELSNNEEYMDAVKFDLSIFKKNVYCFSPKGDVISLTSGSTVIDFAYAIHSAVGNHMVGARVNGAVVPFNHELNTGDRVEVITSQNQNPSKDWLNIVKTTQARTKINQWFKKQNRADNIQRGKDLLEEKAKSKGVSLDELLADNRMNSVLKRYNFTTFDSLCATIGYGGLREGQVINRLYEEYKQAQPVIVEDLVDELLKAGNKESPNARKTKSGVYIPGVGDADVRFSKCCSPLPGDEVAGFVTRGRGVTIHRTDCVNIIHLDESSRRRLIEVEWSIDNERRTYRADLRIHCMDRENMLLDITRILSDEGLNVKALNVRSDRGEVIMDLGVELSSRNQLQKLQEKIKRQSGVYDIERVTV
ncbi:MAG: bifunctional (p)ppGpp synthetase/guanosine-3',5'-bis(diphosphate) 3'-pyrophosphohydrolase [Defluviitaleaceae bacterium]|nr:bifunctional (p)ppGpp synthetase/guanosine-3',5'-bis(diphosphate) 3'-pyrophosphohydrolase [Defluviitaleaceae bacterium]